MPRPKISVATRIRFSNALNAVYREILKHTCKICGGNVSANNDVPLLLLETRVDGDTWEIARHKKFVELNGAGDRLDEDHNLQGC